MKNSPLPTEHQADLCNERASGKGQRPSKRLCVGGALGVESCNDRQHMELLCLSMI